MMSFAALFSRSSRSPSSSRFWPHAGRAKRLSAIAAAAVLSSLAITAVSAYGQANVAPQDRIVNPGHAIPAWPKGKDRFFTPPKRPVLQADPTQTNPEVWIPPRRPIDDLRLTAIYPVANGSCRPIIFRTTETMRTRKLTLKNNSAIALSGRGPCLITLRNASGSRTVVVRIDEAFASVAVAAPPQIYNGLALAPRQTIALALRSAVPAKVVAKLEIVWKSDLENKNVKVDFVDLKFHNSANR
ncbi:MAG: hypothetical protein AAFR04_06570 [Pseudomonadota bacterium]